MNGGLAGGIGLIRRIDSRPLAWDGDFIDLAARFAHRPGTVLLLSGGDLDCARHHILGIRPAFTLTGSRDQVRIRTDSTTRTTTADPLSALRQVIRRCRVAVDADPIAAGLLGYLSYDLKDTIERLPRTSVDDLHLPRLWMCAPRILVVRDKIAGTTTLHTPVWDHIPSGDHNRLMAWFTARLAAPDPDPGTFRGDAGGFRSVFEKTEYMAAIRRIREYIAAGHVYQVNMSQRFEMGFSGSPFALFRALYALNPAPFFAYIHAGDHQILSTSPERFIQMAGDAVETRPIKGTRPRGDTPERDAAHAADLQQSPKDDAELSMIVDLLRNDIGKVCRAGTVKVDAHKRLEAYQNVYHLVSVVTGRLDPGRDAVDLIRATFPGGSITGCPKVRAMEIIDELEPVRRHLYTGSIGYISFHDTMDLSIAIRTATVIGERILFSVGGGIVYDSDPADEFDETLHKGRTLMSAFGGEAAHGPPEPRAWVNGKFLPLSAARIPLSHPGAQYGYGCFETIRVSGGTAHHLGRHIRRFSRAWEALFSGPLPDITWDAVIDQLIEENGLTGQTAAAKIMAFRGDRDAPPRTHTLAVTVRPYTHRLAGKEAAGLHLLTYPHPRQSPLADHKTLNYLYYARAGEWARKNGADEALILNPDGSVSEGHTANLLLAAGRTIVVPASPHVLPGIMQGRVLAHLARTGWRVEKKRVDPGDVAEADGVILTNALMGAVSAVSLDGTPIPPAAALCEEINQQVWKEKD